jgi:hypothetical protein
MDPLHHRRVGSCAAIERLYRRTGEECKGSTACQPQQTISAWYSKLRHIVVAVARAFSSEKSRGPA